jgi:hypothetical protein
MQSIFGTSTPSVKHFALVINALFDLANSLTMAFLFVVGCLPETVNVAIGSKSKESVI